MSVVNVNGSVAEYFSLLREMRGISPIAEKMLNLLCALQQKPQLSFEAQKVLLIYLSLLEDGNTRIPLDAERLYAKWEQKWNGLVVQAESRDALKSFKRTEPYLAADTFKPLIMSGVRDIAAGKYTQIIGDNATPLRLQQTPRCDYLISAKHLEDKNHIENIFKSGFFKESLLDGSAVQLAKDFVQGLLREGSPIHFDDRQAEVIARGVSQNLIVTGGPGTGKTTVIGFLLWKLFASDADYLNWDLYMAAPSGKAADRLAESMDDTLHEISTAACDENPRFVEKLAKASSYTLHRLLKYSVAKGGFTFNSGNPLPEKAIYIIDEASMIDVSLFAAFLQALPPSGNFKLFILGDPNQLPSVDAGAVLGNILEFDYNFVVKLIRSNRFNDESRIGVLAGKIQRGEEVAFEAAPFNARATYWEERDSVHLIDLDQGQTLSRREELRTVENLVRKWSLKFYVPLIDLAEKVDPDIPSECVTPEQRSICEKLWDAANQARILSAERRGNRGVETLNQIVAETLTPNSSTRFVGQILIFNRNQNEFKLYNGDTGIVVKSNRHEQYFLMLKKQSKFVFYPLSYFAEDCLEPSFAITIHKSQGSGYPNVMMFLPTRKGHPLLNRQILYTGITRTKKQSLSIIATPETFKAACETVIERDTGIEL
ncbi:DNA helicase/exodeoxyribonuclease V, alpha subunit [Fibrobacter sp. UWB15]|uniref:AAA family ATPase n=1 Tax=unclassified Fibrobacter TaxID=2634177 RepID=UPI0009204060|nr:MULTISPECIES: AAA family ATPase [unclassified Fibrobacter]PWJ63435.1 DNA helicase/exodeoxyribonuclease V alpha subunit [Fibrobacter sp. UWB6]SHG32427.1 DNA helicase/exodeoxyribonuclease V, alpha subunit [Fibrobacter sp. UWB8]SMG35870.1 DNA helicase/exodeoxyribonuclease V, alpha subunit [Fibrobacter sp. UWB15]